MRRAWGLVVVLLLGASCSGDGGGDAGGPELVPLGTVALVRGDETVMVSEPLTLSTGDVVRSGTDGGAVIEWPDGRSVELAPETQLQLDSPTSPELLSGSALVEAAEGLGIAAGEAYIRGFGGIFRLDRDVQLRVGVYEGVAEVPGSGWDGQIGALSEAFVTALAGTVTQEPRPLGISPDDPWDARILGPAIDVGLRIADLERGLAAQLRGRTDAAVAVLQGDFRREDLAELLRTVAPAELVVAAQAALLAAEKHDLRPLTVLREILAFRAEGATWPLVVAQWDLERAALLVALVRASEDVTARLQPPARPSARDGTAPGPGATPGAVASPAPGPGGDGGPTPSDGGGDPPSRVQPPDDDPPGELPGEPPPPDEDDCTGTADCLVDGLITGARGLLPG